jgi:hypothetical protein
MIAIKPGFSTCSENSTDGCSRRMKARASWKAIGNRDKLVLMSFPDETAYHAWADSPEYLEISKDRKAAAQAIVLLAKGFTQQA